ncbi:MAG TPA: hypothetical protein VG889_16850 [Rhizomicrobium sp.]|nr:hypothetical protein [Rhizomicrobium sp.]
MYRPYVGGKSVKHKHLPSILDIEIEYPERHWSLWLWLALIAAAGALATAAWLGKLPI